MKGNVCSGQLGIVVWGDNGGFGESVVGTVAWGEVAWEQGIQRTSLKIWYSIHNNSQENPST
jgi:hypothetical protein